jgi:hypothetical protein
MITSLRLSPGPRIAASLSTQRATSQMKTCLLGVLRLVAGPS